MGKRGILDAAQKAAKVGAEGAKDVATDAELAPRHLLLLAHFSAGFRGARQRPEASG